MELITITNAVLAAVIIGLTQVAKKFIPARFITLFPLLLGVLGAGAVSGWTTEAIITGLIIGLGSIGLYNQKKIAA